jgi:hypothetical protein
MWKEKDRKKERTKERKKERVGTGLCLKIGEYVLTMIVVDPMGEALATRLGRILEACQKQTLKSFAWLGLFPLALLTCSTGRS